jgi:serine/threonine-protein kinase
MSPEQAQALVEEVPISLDGRSDIYALGVILFQLLTGHVPYSASTGLETAKRHFTEPVPQLHSMELDLIKTYQPIINRAMAKDPADRYANAASLTRHLREVTSGRWYLARLADRTKLVEPAETVKAEAETNLAEPEPPSLLTHNIGRYLIERELGRGGMAVVYLAYDPRLKRRVAIKILPPQFMKLPRFQDRFHQEAELVARLKHPAIVSIYDFGESAGQPFIVMQYLPGGTLAEQLRKGPIKLQLLAPIMARVAAALDEAHAQHVIHHDVKPGNIIFNTGGEAFLSDFGIAVLAEATAVLSEHKDLGFTPNYVSPERVRAYRAKRPAEVDGRSDIYSLGVVLFEALTGHIPFQADNPLATGLAHVEAPIPQIDEIEPSLIKVAQKIIERALAKSPGDRYQTAGELAQAVKELASGRWVFRKLLE